MKRISLLIFQKGITLYAEGLDAVNVTLIFDIKMKWNGIFSVRVSNISNTTLLSNPT